MVSVGLVEGTNSLNTTKEAFDTKTAQLQTARDTDQSRQDAGVARERATTQFDQGQQDRKDNEMLKVFGLAGDGYIAEAQHFAQAKGLEVPQDIYNNAWLAKGLETAGTTHPSNPAAAQKFTMAWMSNQGGLQDRYMAGQQAAGVPVDANNRDFQQWVRKEQWKLDNKVATSNKGFTLGAGQTRYDAAGNQIAAGAPKQDDGRINFISKQAAAAKSGSMIPITQEQEAAQNQFFGEQYDALVKQQQQPAVPEPQQQDPYNLTVPAPPLEQYVAQPAPPQQQTIQEGSIASNPSTGERVIFQGGQWVPLANQ